MSSHRRMVEALAKFSETCPPRAATVRSTHKQDTHMFRQMIEAGQQTLGREIRQALDAAQRAKASGHALKAKQRQSRAMDYTLRLSRLTSWAEERMARMPTPKTPPAVVHHFAKP